MTAIAEALATVVGGDRVVHGPVDAYVKDETETRLIVGSCAAVVEPRSAEEVACVVRWAYEHDVPIVPRGGGTGYAGGAVPFTGSVVLSLAKLTAFRRFDPELWRAEVEAGVTTHVLQRRARENGLLYPPDPGAGEQSQLGGNIATNAGGPHAFKYGTTSAWITGLEAVVPPGEVITVGGPITKDVAGYDLKRVLIGSEGTLGVITCAWVRFIPAPEARHPVVGLFPSTAAGVEAIEAMVANGVAVAVLDYLDHGALAAAPPGFADGVVSEPPAFALLCEADGTVTEARTVRADAIAVIEERGGIAVAPLDASAVAGVWRWREGLTGAVTTVRGGKVSEDIVVPLDRLLEAIERTHTIAAAVGLPACSWGHAGDGNLHSTFLVDTSDPDQLRRAEAGAIALFDLAVELGGSLSGEHGLGLVKSGQLERFWAPRKLELHRGIKTLFDPKGLMNPGKKQ
ncbi:MAG TPA: FAD-linked oxidase C-terminal domain-containing protein [Gaiellaceae bacterium]|jgi:glycolate oxidase subunit GlcD